MQETQVLNSSFSLDSLKAFFFTADFKTHSENLISPEKGFWKLKCTSIAIAQNFSHFLTFSLLCNAINLGE